MRREEIFVLDSIVKHLEGARWIEGEDPPDAYIVRNGAEVAIEVTRLTEISYDKEGKAKNRVTEDMSGLGLIDEFNAKYGAKVPVGNSVRITLSVPLLDFRNFKKKFSNWLEDNISQLDCNERDVEICGNRISIKCIPDRYGLKQIGGIVSNHDAGADISLNAETILGERVSAKEEIFLKNGFEGERWLGLLNNYKLADVGVYLRALSKGKIKHGFARIYLVEEDGSVSQIA